MTPKVFIVAGAVAAIGAAAFFVLRARADAAESGATYEDYVPGIGGSSVPYGARAQGFASDLEPDPVGYNASPPVSPPGTSPPTFAEQIEQILSGILSPPPPPAVSPPPPPPPPATQTVQQYVDQILAPSTIATPPTSQQSIAIPPVVLPPVPASERPVIGTGKTIPDDPAKKTPGATYVQTLDEAKALKAESKPVVYQSPAVVAIPGTGQSAGAWNRDASIAVAEAKKAANAPAGTVITTPKPAPVVATSPPAPSGYVAVAQTQTSGGTVTKYTPISPPPPPTVVAPPTAILPPPPAAPLVRGQTAAWRR